MEKVSSFGCFLGLLIFLGSSAVPKNALAQPTWQWAVRESGPNVYYQSPRLTTTATGQVVSLAALTDTPNAVHRFPQQAVLTAVDSTGVVQWRRVVGGTGAYCVVSDLKAIPGPTGGFYALLEFAGILDLGAAGQFTSATTGTLQARDGAVVRFDATGQLQWARHVRGQPNLSGGSNNIRLYSLAVDRDGTVWVGGRYHYALNIAPYTFQPQHSGGTGFLARYNATGAVLSVFPFGGFGSSRVTSIVPHPRGGVLISGGNESPALPVGIGAFVLPLATCDFFVARFSAQMQPEWVRSHVGADSTTADFLGLNRDGGYFVAGHMKGNTRFGGTTFTSGGRADTDLFVVRYDSLGQVRWAQRAATPGRDVLSSAAFDPQGHAYLATWAGGMGHALTIGPSTVPLVAGNGLSAVFARLTPQGAPDWVLSTADVGEEIGAAIIPDSGRAVYCAGFFTASVALGPASLVSVNAGDYFLGRVANGQLLGRGSSPVAVGELSLYPNPATSGQPVVVGLPAGAPEASVVELRDALGRVVRRVVGEAGAQTLRLEVDQLPAGLYLVEVTTGRHKTTKRLVLAP